MANGHSHGHGHSHGVIDSSIIRSRAGLRAVSLSLAVLLATTIAQLIVLFLLRSQIAEKRAGYFVVATIFVSATVAAIAAINQNFRPGPNMPLCRHFVCSIMLVM